MGYRWYMHKLVTWEHDCSVRVAHKKRSRGGENVERKRDESLFTA
jgi:hypothetical protein